MGMKLINMNNIYCEDCGELTPNPHQGRCLSCNLKRVKGTPLPENACCTHCEEKRRAVLNWTDLGRDRVVLCHNCRLLGMKVKPRPQSLAEFQSRLQREVWTEQQRLDYVFGIPRASTTEIDQLVTDLESLAKVL